MAFLDTVRGLNVPTPPNHFDDLIQAAYTGPVSNTRIAFRYIDPFAEKTERRLGENKYVGINGVEYQDNGDDSGRHRMMCFFSGPKHPDDARTFRDLLHEPAPKGRPGLLEHPRKKVVEVVVASSEIIDDPNKDANRTVLFVVMYEQLTLPADVQERPDIAVQKQLERFNTAAADDFSLGLILDTIADEVATIRETVSAVNVITETMGTILATQSGVLSDFNAIKQDILNNIDTLIHAPATLAAGMTRLVQSAISFPGELFDKHQAYEDTYRRILGIDDDAIPTLYGAENDSVTSNRAHVQALMASLSSAAMMTNIVQNVGQFTTKQSAYDNATESMLSAKNVVDSLEDVEALYTTDEFQRQFFGLNTSLAELNVLSRLCYASTQELTNNLLATKVIVLERDTQLLQVLYTEYGDDFETYENAFIETNNLSLEEMVIIPLGRRLLV